MSDPSAITVSVLGSSGGYPALGFPCSGYLITTDGARILLDCGPGVATALLAQQETVALDGVVITHLHPDHLLDLVPLAYACLAEWRVDGRSQPLPVHLPQGGIALLRQMSDLFGHRAWRFGDEERGAGHARLRAARRAGADWLETVLELIEHDPGARWSIGSARVATIAADHGAGAMAVRVEAAGRAIGYTGDTRFVPGHAAFFAGVDVLFADAHHSGPRGAGGAHMSPEEAARLAALAGARRLVLCHLGSPADADAALQSAAAYPGPAHAAVRDRRFTL